MALAPRALREVSPPGARAYSLAHGVDVSRELVTADGGDLELTLHDHAQALETVRVYVESVVRSGIVGGYLGGDGSLSLAALRGIRRAKLKRTAFVRFAADCGTAPGDSRPRADNVVRCATDEALLNPEHVVLVGQRGPLASQEELAFARAQGFELITLDDVKWDLHAAVSQLRRWSAQSQVYVSIDLSVLDPAYAPAVSQPRPGGLSTWELQQLLRALVGADVVAFDVVGLVPAADPTRCTAHAALAAVHEVLAVIADTRRSATAVHSPRHADERRRSP
jgi:agmatinase/guanidinopropionase